MGKIMDELKAQEKIEGLTEDLKLVYKIYDAVLRTSRSSNTFREIVEVQFMGTYPNSKKFRYTSPLVRELMKIKGE